MTELIPPKLFLWMQTSGRRLINLKLRGGYHWFRNRATPELNDGEAYEFFQLVGQLDILMWVFHPETENEYTILKNNIKQMFVEFEEEFSDIKKIAGTIKLPKGDA